MERRKRFHEKIKIYKNIIIKYKKTLSGNGLFFQLPDGVFLARRGRIRAIPRLFATRRDEIRRIFRQHHMPRIVLICRVWRDFARAADMNLCDIGFQARFFQQIDAFGKRLQRDRADKDFDGRFDRQNMINNISQD